jgi:hypothetical protein
LWVFRATWGGPKFNTLFKNKFSNLRARYFGVSPSPCAGSWLNPTPTERSELRPDRTDVVAAALVPSAGGAPLTFARVWFGRRGGRAGNPRGKQITVDGIWFELKFNRYFL